MLAGQLGHFCPDMELFAFCLHPGQIIVCIWSLPTLNFSRLYAMQGMLSIGAAMLGSVHVIGVDIDEDALQTAQENCEQFEDLQVCVKV